MRFRIMEHRPDRWVAQRRYLGCLWITINDGRWYDTEELAEYGIASYIQKKRQMRRLKRVTWTGTDTDLAMIKRLEGK